MRASAQVNEVSFTWFTKMLLISISDMENMQMCIKISVAEVIPHTLANLLVKWFKLALGFVQMFSIEYLAAGFLQFSC